MKRSVRLTLYGIGCGLIVLFALTICQAAEDYSHARIVRLSYVEGTVTLQRPDVSEWAEAPVNTPLQEGFKIATGEGGFAEVEFENGSTVRLGQLSLLEFTQLALLPSGGKVNRLTLLEGYGTLNVIPQGEDFYEVKAASATLTPRGKTRFRVDLNEGFVQVKVFKGTVELQSPEGNGTLGHDTVLVIRPGEGQHLQLTEGITKDAWDEWVEGREEVAQAMRNRGAPSAVSAGMSDFFYGFVDLMFYGSWSSSPDYGAIWIPTVNPGWNPYASGRWCYYPGIGFVWIPAEPWGWIPCHYGNWVYQPGRGWFWVPGGFGGWSPAVVTWHQGPGWVGWSPRPPGRGGSLSPCAHPGCTTVAGVNDFRQGKPVGPHYSAGVNIAQGRPVDRPDIQPDRTGRLPGAPHLQPVFHSPAVDRPDQVRTSGRPAVTALPATAGRAPAAAPETTPAFTRGTTTQLGAVPAFGSPRPATVPRTGPQTPVGAAPPAADRSPQVRNTSPAVAAPTAASTNRPAAPASDMVRPGPRVNYPAPTAREYTGGPAGGGPENRPQPGGTRSGWGESQPDRNYEVDSQRQFNRGNPGGRDSGAGQNNGTPAYNSRAPQVRSGDMGSQTVVRSAPSASARSDGGARSSDRSTSSGRSSSSSVSGGSSSRSSGGSYSGGSSSSHSSGGYSGGSSSSHSGGGGYSGGSSSSSGGGGSGHSGGSSAGGSSSSSSPKH